MIGYLTWLAQFIHQYFVHIVCIAIVIWKWEDFYLRLFIQPISGGNGVTQPDELAKFVVIVMAVVEWLTKRDPIFMGELLGAVIGIAFAQKQTGKFLNFTIPKKDETKPDSTASSSSPVVGGE